MLHFAKVTSIHAHLFIILHEVDLSRISDCFKSNIQGQIKIFDNHKFSLQKIHVRINTLARTCFFNIS